MLVAWVRAAASVILSFAAATRSPLKDFVFDDTFDDLLPGGGVENGVVHYRDEIGLVRHGPARQDGAMQSHFSDVC
jgi:hypothetical protein